MGWDGEKGMVPTQLDCRGLNADLHDGHYRPVQAVGLKEEKVFHRDENTVLMLKNGEG